jgi:tetratricopeptide (TPR) repeat protein
LGKVLVALSCCALICAPALARTVVNIDALLQNAQLSASSGNYKTAISLYNKALKSRKNDVSIYQLRAKTRLVMSQPKAALTDLNKAVALNGNDPTNYELRARAFEALENYKKEKLDLDRLLTLTQPSAVNLLWRAHISAELKKMKDVVADCDQALSLGLPERKDLIDLYKLRAQAYKKLGRKQEATRELAKLDAMQ